MFLFEICFYIKFDNRQSEIFSTKPVYIIAHTELIVFYKFQNESCESYLEKNTIFIFFVNSIRFSLKIMKLCLQSYKKVNCLFRPEIVFQFLFFHLSLDFYLAFLRSKYNKDLSAYSLMLITYRNGTNSWACKQKNIDLYSYHLMNLKPKNLFKKIIKIDTNKRTKGE